MSPLPNPFRRSSAPPEVEPAPLVLPRATVDGWTLDGTPLAAAVPRGQQRELSTLLHGVAIGVDTPWTYERAVELLEAAGQSAQAHAVCHAWLARPAAAQPANAHATRNLTRARDRLRARLATSGAQSG